MKKDIAQVAKEMKSYIEALAKSWPEGETNAIDRQAMAIEADIPKDTKNEDAIKAREYAQLARKFGMTDKGVNYIADAQAAFKDYMLFEDAETGEGYRAEQRKKAQVSRKNISGIIADLALEKDELGDFIPAPDLWSPLFAALQDAEATPIETRNNSEPRKSIYTYINGDGEQDKIQRGTFETKISKCRKKLSQ